MEEVLHYLELKNQYYEKFYSVTARFLEQAQQNQWNDIELFVDNRERILSIIRSYDFKIAKHFQDLNLGKNQVDGYRDRVQELLRIRGEIAQKIVSTDLELIAKMDEMKTETIRELKKSMKVSHGINSFAPATADKPRLKPRKDA